MSDQFIVISESDLARFLCRFANRAQEVSRAELEQGQQAKVFDVDAVTEVIRSEPFFVRRTATSPMIAAAPELLAACEAALPLLAGYSWTDENRAVLKALSEAIAKAKGEEN